jgi:uncharacterized protein
MPNNLINETSPYLLQHANNPVNWYAWNDETLALAKQENKLILVSIGYSACHWCHVMEHQSFEDEAVAKIMNAHFINIKIDREERPDIDMVYMGAVQLMTGQGGWPLNCFALPDGRPIYGGTYFPKEQWINILENLADLYKTKPDKAYEYAANLTDGLERLEIPKISNDSTFSMDVIKQSIENWKPRFDTEFGGPNRAPKFPLPNNYLFLLHYCFYENDLVLKQQVQTTLTKMAWGGIYDQIGGGFARYSTDLYWKVPHFEKMLYDNAQLLSLYTQAYKQSKNELYKKVVYQTVEFIKAELTSSQHGFYSALDADSESVEGKFYVWQKHELVSLLKDDFEIYAQYYSVNEVGYWEDDNYILLRNEDEKTIAFQHQLTVEALQQKIERCNTLLLAQRNKRIKPGLDNKIITSWNALLIKALAEAYLIFEEEAFKTLALNNAIYLLKNHYLTSGEVLRIKNDKTSIAGFLDDYAFLIDAFINLYLITIDELYLTKAKEMADYTLANFYDEKQNTFFYTDASKEKLIVRKAEWSDNVIPASSSQMAINLNTLGIYFENQTYLNTSKSLLIAVANEMVQYGAGYSNWAILYLQHIKPQHQVVIVGKSVNEYFKTIYKTSPPNVIFALSNQNSNLPLLKNRFIKDKTTVYVCQNNTCMLPTEFVDVAIKQLEDFYTA